MAAAKKDAEVKQEADVKQEQKEEMYEIRLFKDNNKYRDDVFVGVNGRGYIIKRGERVRVPAAVYEVLMNSMNQDEYTAKLIDQESSEYERESRARGL